VVEPQVSAASSPLRGPVADAIQFSKIVFSFRQY